MDSISSSYVLTPGALAFGMSPLPLMTSVETGKRVGRCLVERYARVQQNSGPREEVWGPRGQGGD